MKIKTLTLHRPWAHLIADGRKRIETRSWFTHYRGPLAIHAGQAIDEDFARECGYDPAELEPGRLLCIVHLADCVKMDRAFIRAASRDEKRFGDFAVGRYAWILEQPRRVGRQVRVTGKQGMWNLSVDSRIWRPSIITSPRRRR